MGRFLRRAGLRAAVAAIVSWVVLRPLRGRPGLRTSAAAAAATVGAVQELPIAAIPTGVLGSVLAARARPSGGDGVAGAAVGAVIGLGTRRVWPVAPRTPAQVRRMRTPMDSQASPDGDGVTIVVNAAAGSASNGEQVEDLRRALPGAKVIVVDDPGELERSLAEAAEGAVVGASGGDGTINTAAGVAHAAGKPLLVVPGGTLNHFTRDLGVEGLDDVVAALHAGRTVAVDTASIDGRPFLNTASFGAYTDLVDAREQLEARIGKWPAVVVALARVLARSAPIDVELDGRRRKLWMVFVGNCCYEPSGFAASWRGRLDDGLLDVRVVDGTHPFARIRLLLAVMTGQLARSAVYDAFTTDEFHVRSLQGPLRLACDGETFDGGAEFTVRKEARPLPVYAPASDDGSLTGTA